MCTAAILHTPAPTCSIPYKSVNQDELNAIHAKQRASLFVSHCSNADFNTALMIAFADPHVNINEVDYNGESALTWSSYYGNHDMCRWLIQKGANIHVRAKSGWNALLNAVSRQWTHVVSLLLRHQSSLDITTQHGNTALHMAADKGWTEGVKMLLDAGANVNIRNEYGDTPLMLAVWSSHLECVQLLLQSAAELEWMTIKTNRTALGIACHKGYCAIIEYLVAYGASVELAGPSAYYRESSIAAGRKLASSNDQQIRLMLIHRDIGMVRDLANIVLQYLSTPLPTTDDKKQSLIQDSKEFEMYLNDVSTWNSSHGYEQLEIQILQFRDHPDADVETWEQLLKLPRSAQPSWRSHWNDIRLAIKLTSEMEQDLSISDIAGLFDET